MVTALYLAVVAAASILATAPIAAQSGGLFSDFSGANLSPARLSRPDLWRQLGLGMARIDASWPAVQPGPGEWKWDDLDARVLECANAGVPVVLMVGYTPAWTAVDGDYAFEEAGHRWQVSVGPFDAVGNSRSVRFRGLPLAGGEALEGSEANLRFRKVSDWTRFVDLTVRRYSAPPFNVRYYQIWNEFNWPPPWYMGTWRDFIDRVHLPAARVIRSHGGKVVFGGWACTAGPQELCDLLEYNDAWRMTDIIDFHYQTNAAFEVCYERFVKSGKCHGVWQTEVGWTNWKEYLINTYCRVFYWALKHGYDTEDRFRMFWFHFVGPPDLALTDQFTSGQPLTDHGRCLRTLANILTGPVRAWRDFTTDPALDFTLTEEQPSAEGFATPHSVVVAAHLSAEMLGRGKVFTLRLRGLASLTLEVSVLDRYGEPLSARVEDAGKDLVVSIPLDDLMAETWRFEAKGTTVLVRALVRRL
ncbi:MAG: hypothetical protein N2512_05830 [Armatimonadetes bacterium]|nr:hypothetical protein [Armatimonadota bacterium]